MIVSSSYGQHFADVAPISAYNLSGGKLISKVYKGVRKNLLIEVKNDRRTDPQQPQFPPI
jgi:hypothetical protein